MGTRNISETTAHRPERPEEIPDPLDLGPPVRQHLAEYPVGTRRQHADGRINVKTEDGWRPEARIVLEREIGRPLAENEEARKRKGTAPWDNRPECLQLWRDGHPSRTPRKRTSTSTRRRRAWKSEAIAAAEAATILYALYLAAAGIRPLEPAGPEAAEAADPA